MLGERIGYLTSPRTRAYGRPLSHQRPSIRPVTPLLPVHVTCPFLTQFLTCLTVRTPGAHHLFSPFPTTKSGGSSVDDLTAYGTVALAGLTFLTLITTIFFSLNGNQQLKSERKDILFRESHTEAYAVQVIGISTVIVINHGHYTISDITARLRTRDSHLMNFERSDRIIRVSGEAAELGADATLEADFRSDILTPWDTALRFFIDPARISGLVGAYPIVRWTDHGNNRWEYRRGKVEKVEVQAPWSTD